MSELERDSGFWQSELQRFLPDPAAALEDALEYVCCPVCKVAADLPFEYFRFLPKRWEEEPLVREHVCRAGGFCNHHTWRLNRIQCSLSLATAYVDILAAQSEVGVAAAPEPCPVCRLEQLAEETLIEGLLRRLTDPSGREGYARSFGLCGPHLRRTLARNLDESVRTALLEAHRDRSQWLIDLLRGYIEKNEVPARWNRTDAENRSPRWAMLKAAGNEDL